MNVLSLLLALASTQTDFQGPSTYGAHITGIGMNIDGTLRLQVDPMLPVCRANKDGWIDQSPHDPPIAWQLAQTLFLKGDEVRIQTRVVGDRCVGLARVGTMSKR